MQLIHNEMYHYLHLFVAVHVFKIYKVKKIYIFLRIIQFSVKQNSHKTGIYTIYVLIINSNLHCRNLLLV